MAFSRYVNAIVTHSYTFAGTSPTRETFITYGTCSTGCGTTTPTVVAIGNNINNRIGSVYTNLNSNRVAQANYTYDGSGNLLKTQLWTGTTFIAQTTNNVYNTNGTPSKLYDVANNETDYSYIAASYIGCASCTRFPFPTQVKNANTGNYINTVWYGVGGVKSTDTESPFTKSGPATIFVVE